MVNIDVGQERNGAQYDSGHEVHGENLALDLCESISGKSFEHREACEKKNRLGLVLFTCSF